MTVIIIFPHPKLKSTVVPNHAHKANCAILDSPSTCVTFGKDNEWRVVLGRLLNTGWIKKIPTCLVGISVPPLRRNEKKKKLISAERVYCWPDRGI